MRAEDFDLELLSRAGKIPVGDYYLNMGVAWFFSVALVKNFDLSFGFLRDADIDPWIKRKALTKALESFRVTVENKDKIRALRKIL